MTTSPAQPMARGPMSFEVAAELLGWVGGDRARRLRRMLLRIELQTKRTLLVRCGGRGRGARYLVTLGALRDAFPGVVSKRDAIVAEIREHIERRDEEHAEAIQALKTRVTALAVSLRQRGESGRELPRVTTRSA